MKNASHQNIEKLEKEDRQSVYRINNNVSYIPKSTDPLDTVIDILDENIKHKKTTHPYVLPQAETALTTEIETQALDDEFATLKEQYNRVGNVAAEQKNQKESEELVEGVIQEKIPLKILSLMICGLKMIFTTAMTHDL